MPFEIHTIEAVPGAAPALNDRIIYGVLWQQAYAAGGGAGASVNLVITGLKLPASLNYMVDVELPADACYFVTSKSSTGFTITITPRLAANTLAAGHANIMISA